ncbi:unnamed protein product [Dibothriocephalus latus]|uniref:Uncharacterized protein n=1 Tax=Dibothriocephalus latus TaxID=60516 RepID=A0A3P7L9Z1_DIBLA|nr:unnamed protein product [Dibothriocephalus latus]
MLVASETGIKSLADSVPSSSPTAPRLPEIQPEPDVSDSAAAPSHTSPLRSAMQWHLGLFKFYDRLLQALVKRPDEPEHEKAE